MTEITQDMALKAYREAPEYVRDVFNSDTTTQVVMSLQKKYQLHVDAAGTLAKEIGYLLLGLSNPQRFSDRLRTQGFADATIKAIVTEVNQKIFVPLRQAEEHASAKQTPVAPKPKPAPPMPPRVSIPAQAPAAPATPPSPMPRTPITDPERELPVGENASAAAPAPQHPASAPLPPKALQPRSGAAGLPGSLPAMGASRPTPPPIRQQFAPPPPQNLPGAMPAARGPMQSKSAPPPPAKPYEVDPYREPPE